MERTFEKSKVNFIGKTLFTMAFGLLVTFITAMVTVTFMKQINIMLMIGCMVVEVGIVLFLVRRIEHMSTTTAKMWFVAYAALNGFTLSTIFTTYRLGTVVIVFLITSAMFFCSGMIGMTAKRDLSAFGQFFMMMIVGLILMSLFQVFFHLQGLNFMISVLGIITFCGLTAYDMQKIKRFHAECYAAAPQEVSKFVIIAALQLYLDFINLFLYVLELFNND